MRHFLTFFDLTTEEVAHLLSETDALKGALQRGERQPILANRVLGLVFEKPSLRTRAGFEAAVAQMGGSSIFLSALDGSMGQRESVSDFARTLAEYVDAVVLRVFKHSTIEEFASHCRVPVINGLSDLFHPCQALGDLYTMHEVFGSLKDRTLVFVGDGNNVSRSLAVICALLGVRFILAAPEAYGFETPFLRRFAERFGKEPLQMRDPVAAISHADVVYTDVWISMGQEAERERRLKQFVGYQLNADLMAQAPSHCRVMHCLPARRGEEITDEILDGERSIVFQQAGNRMHVQKALLKWLML